MKILKTAVTGLGSVGVVAGGITAYVLVNKKSTVDTGPVNNTMYHVDGFDTTPYKYSNKDFRIANWNMMNYEGSKTRTDAFAKIINHEHIALLGAEEIDKVSSLHALANRLNELTKTTSWKVIASKLAQFAKKDDGTLMHPSGVGQWEYYGFIYNSDLVNPKSFKNGGELGMLYENPLVENHYLTNVVDSNGVQVNTKSAFVRQPYGVEFETKDHKDFTTVIAHLDSPGGVSGSKSWDAKPKNSSSKDAYKTYELNMGATNVAKTGAHPHPPLQSGRLNPFGTAVGSQELFEAEQVKNAMDWFNNKNGDDNDMIFMADTNMPKLKNDISPFDNLTNPTSPADDIYKSLLDPSLASSKTSLSNRARNYGDEDNSKTGRIYVNPFDRIYTNSPLLSKDNADKFDVSKAFSIIDTHSLHIDTTKPGDFASKVSDHTMVYGTYDMTKAEKGNSGTTTSEQANAEVQINTASYYELTTKFGFTDKEANKVIYYRNLVGQIDESTLRSLVNYYIKGGNLYPRLKEIHDVYHTTIKYDAPVVTHTKEMFRQVNDYSHGLGQERTISKLDINALSYVDLAKYNKEGLIGKSTFESIAKLRGATPLVQITSKAQLKNHFDISDFEDSIFDYTGTVAAIDNPLDINHASPKAMIDSLVGYNSVYGLSEYHIWAMLAYRSREGKIDNQYELQKVIGSYAAGKLNFSALFTGAVTPVAEVATKLNINKVSQADLVKYMGSKIGPKIYKFIFDKGMKDTANHEGISSLAELKVVDSRNSYWYDQLGQIFEVVTSNKIVPDAVIASIPPVQVAGQISTDVAVSFADLKTEALKVISDTTYSSKNFTAPVLTKMEVFRKFFLSKISASVKSDPNFHHYFGVKSSSKAMIQHLVVAINSESTWSDALAIATKPYHPHTATADSVEAIKLLNTH